MEARQRDELELVSHGRQFGLEARDAGVIQFLLPVKRRRAVVGQQLAGMFCQHRFCELSRFLQVWLGSLPPKEISIWRIGNTASNRGFQPATNAEEPFSGAVTSEEFVVSRVDIAGQQVGAVGVGT